MLVSWLHETEKTKPKYHDSYSYLLVQQKKFIWIYHGKNQIQPAGTTF